VRIRGAGIRRTISMSNTRKITASRKNRVENGRRALSFGSKPHSKGVDFSRSLKLRELRIKESTITRVAIIVAKKVESIVVSIHTGSLTCFRIKRPRLWHSFCKVDTGGALIINFISVIRSSGAVSLEKGSGY